jgi:DNA polymerase-3 subunit epsilon
MGGNTGILTRNISESPIAVFDFETTGLTPGVDRVVEISVARIDPGEEPRLVLDTLVNPMRRMGATEIHGITDADVIDALGGA